MADTPKRGVTPEFVHDLTQRITKIRDLSEAGGFVLPADLTVSLSKLRSAVMQREIVDSDSVEASVSSLSFDSSQYSDEGEKLEAKRVKIAREDELRRMKEQSSRLRASVASRMSDFKSECGQFMERSMRTSFEVTSYRQELQKMQASLDSVSRPPQRDTSPRLTPESSLLDANRMTDQVREMQHELDLLHQALQSHSSYTPENEQLREMIKRLELTIEPPTEKPTECKIKCSLW